MNYFIFSVPNTEAVGKRDRSDYAKAVCMVKTCSNDNLGKYL